MSLKLDIAHSHLQLEIEHSTFHWELVIGHWTLDIQKVLTINW